VEAAVEAEAVEKAGTKESLEIGSVRHRHAGRRILLRGPTASNVVNKGRKVRARTEARAEAKVGRLTCQIRSWTIFMICVRSTISMTGWRGVWVRP